MTSSKYNPTAKFREITKFSKVTWRRHNKSLFYQKARNIFRPFSRSFVYNFSCRMTHIRYNFVIFEFLSFPLKWIHIFLVYPHSFLTRCYTLFGETMDLLALINAAIGFVLYGSMSKQFRVTFKSLFFRRRPQKIEMTRVTNINNTTTNVWLKFVRNLFRLNASKM